MKIQIIGFALMISTILSANQISFDSNITKGNISEKGSQNETNVQQAHFTNKCHKGFGRYNSYHNKCLKSVDRNVTLSKVQGRSHTSS